jgi:hypothetical protein
MRPGSGWSVAIRSLSDLREAREAGRIHTQFMTKTNGPVPGAGGLGFWGDMSMGSGQPKYNAYVGAQYEFTPLIGIGNTSIYTGPVPAADQSKYLFDFGIQVTSSAVPMSWQLCDYVGFYPLVDGDNSDPQPLDNSSASIPRYTTGEGLRVFMVCTTPMTTTGQCTMIYTNSAGVSGRTVTFGIKYNTSLGSVVSCGSTGTNSGCFAPLIAGDLGVRSVEQIQFLTAVGGFVSVVLARPLASITSRETSTWTERCLLQEDGGMMPLIPNGTFLQYLCCTATTQSPTIARSALTFVWG